MLKKYIKGVKIMRKKWKQTNEKKLKQTKEKIERRKNTIYEQMVLLIK